MRKKLKTFENYDGHMHQPNKDNTLPEPPNGGSGVPNKPTVSSSSITSSELWRDKNLELNQILNSVSNDYNISKEDASKAIAQYFTTQHWKAGQK